MEYSAWLADNELVPIDKASLVPRMLRGGSPLKRTNRGTFSGNGVGGFVRRHPDLAHTGGLDRVAGVKLKQFQKDSGLHLAPTSRKSRVSRRVKTGLLVGAGVAAGAAGVAAARHHGFDKPGLRGKGSASYNLGQVKQHRKIYDSPDMKQEWAGRKLRGAAHATHIEGEKQRLQTSAMGRVIAHDINRTQAAKPAPKLHGMPTKRPPLLSGHPEWWDHGPEVRASQQARFITNERAQYEGRKHKTLTAAQALHGKKTVQSQTAHAVVRHKDVERAARATAATAAEKAHTHRMKTDKVYAAAVKASEHRIARLEGSYDAKDKRIPGLHDKAVKHWGLNNPKTVRIANEWKRSVKAHEDLIGNVHKSAGGFVVTRPRLVAA